GGHARSRGVDPESGGARSDADRAGALAVAGVAGSRAESGRASSRVEAVDVQRRGADVGVGREIPEGVSAGEAAEYLWIIGSSSRRDLLRRERGRAGGRNGVAADRETDQQYASVCTGRVWEPGAGG